MSKAWEASRDSIPFWSGDDFNEPLSDAARSILDGHISLSRALANKNHYPAVDVLQSISRVMIDIVDAEHKSKAGELANILATYKKAEDIINIGAYVNGSNPAIDRAVRMVDRGERVFTAEVDEKIDFKQAKEQLLGLFQEIRFMFRFKLQSVLDYRLSWRKGDP